jgi:hypothetical protein
VLEVGVLMRKYLQKAGKSTSKRMNLNLSISNRLLISHTYIFSQSITNNTFCIFDSQCYSRDYSIDNRYGGRRNLLHLSKREVCFDDHQKYFGINDGIDNLLEYHPLPKG